MCCPSENPAAKKSESAIKEETIRKGTGVEIAFPITNGEASWLSVSWLILSCPLVRLLDVSTALLTRTRFDESTALVTRTRFAELAITELALAPVLVFCVVFSLVFAAPRDLAVFPDFDVLRDED